VKRALIGTSVLLATMAALLIGPSAAAAERVEITLATPAEAVFSDPWMLDLRLTPAPGAFVPRLGESSGHVDVFIDQVPGVYLEALPVQADGSVFVSQRADIAWLAPGTYDLRAVFTPAAGSGLDAAQARFPAAITILPATVEASSAVLLGEDGSMRVELGFAARAEEPGTIVPVGVWSIAVSEADTGELLESHEIAQGPEVEQHIVPIGADLPAGTELSVTTGFTPVAEYLPGVEIQGLGEERVRTPDLTLAERLIAPVALPVWVVVAIAAGALLGIASLTVVLLRRRRGATTDSDGGGDAVASSDTVVPVMAGQSIADVDTDPAPVDGGSAEGDDDTRPAKPRALRYASAGSRAYHERIST
jgi:hypothetical protein